MVLLPVCQDVHTLRVVDKHFRVKLPCDSGRISMECSANQTCATDLQVRSSPDECHFCGGAIGLGWRARILVNFCVTQHHGPPFVPLNDTHS
jgi:hypothetical protein